MDEMQGLPVALFDILERKGSTNISPHSSTPSSHKKGCIVLEMLTTPAGAAPPPQPFSPSRPGTMCPLQESCRIEAL